MINILTFTIYFLLQLIGSNEGPSVLWTPEKLNKDSILADSINSANNVDFWRYMKMHETKT